MKNETDPTTLVIARKAVIYSYSTLLGLFTVDSLMTLLAGAPGLVVLTLWLIRTVPLLIFLPGLKRKTPRAAAWLCFVILLYFTHAVTVAFVPGELLYGVVYALICTALFSALIAWIRLMRKHHGMTLQ